MSGQPAAPRPEACDCNATRGVISFRRGRPGPARLGPRRGGTHRKKHAHADVRPSVRLVAGPGGPGGPTPVLGQGLLGAPRPRRQERKPSEMKKPPPLAPLIYVGGEWEGAEAARSETNMEKSDGPSRAAGPREMPITSRGGRRGPRSAPLPARPNRSASVWTASALEFAAPLSLSADRGGCRRLPVAAHRHTEPPRSRRLSGANVIW